MNTLDEVKAALEISKRSEAFHNGKGPEPSTDETFLWIKVYQDETDRYFEFLLSEIERLQEEWEAFGKMAGEAMEAHTKAEEENKRLRDVLREVEWGYSTLYGDYERFYCPWCHGSHPEHQPGCKLAALLKGKE